MLKSVYEAIPEKIARQEADLSDFSSRYSELETRHAALAEELSTAAADRDITKTSFDKMQTEHPRQLDELRSKLQMQAAAERGEYENDNTFQRAELHHRHQEELAKLTDTLSSLLASHSTLATSYEELTTAHDGLKAEFDTVKANLRKFNLGYEKFLADRTAAYDIFVTSTTEARDALLMLARDPL